MEKCEKKILKLYHDCVDGPDEASDEDEGDDGEVGDGVQGQAGCVEDDTHVEDDADAVRDGGQETNSARLIPEFKILEEGKFVKLNQRPYF